MPPGDTIIYKTLDQLPDSVRLIIDSLRQFHAESFPPDEKRPQFLFPQWLMFLFVLLLVAVSAYFYIIRPASATKRKVSKILRDNSPGNAVIEMQYDQWLCKFNLIIIRCLVS
ncbi:MAG: hypothetical protein ACRDEB_08685 [Chitinophagaceae bacterium]